MRFKHSSEIIDLIEKRKTNTIKLRSFKAFIEKVGQPQLQLNCIHIGGTNGKGSTTNTVAHIMMEAGYKVGMFTSPYLETHHDRIRINNEFIEDTFIVQCANTYYNDWEQFGLSMFEIDMFIALLYFVENKVDYAVFEVGLGGELDATNIIQPLVCAITNIGLDHMDFLGSTYEAIAQAKAGIVKEGIPLITSEEKGVCLDVFKEVCNQQNSRFILCEQVTHIETQPHLQFNYKNYKGLQQLNQAKYQAKNISLAIEIIDYLNSQNLIQVSEQQLYKGVRKAKWKGRFELVSTHPKIIVDGAHNKEGILALIDTCQNLPNIHIIFSALQDKPFKEMLEVLQTISRDVVVCEFDFYRAATIQNMQIDDNIRAIPDFKKALEYTTKQEGVTIVCGSLYFISQVREYILDTY